MAALGLLLAGGARAILAQPAAPHVVAAGQPLPADLLPGPLRLTIRPAADRDRGQPLLAIGTPARGSVLFWLWDAEGRARIGLEDPRQGLSFSPPFAAATDEAHVLEVSWGALWPAHAASATDASAVLRDFLEVAVDGRRLFCRKQAFDLRASRVIFGANITGSGLCRPVFQGQLVALERADAARTESLAVRAVDLAPQPELLPGGYPGPLHLRLSLPAGVAGRCEPLLVGGRSGSAGFLYVRYDDARHLRLGFDTWGWRGPLSPPIAYEPGADYDLRISVGLLYPPAEHPPQAGDPPLVLGSTMLWAEWAGRPVLATIVPCPAVLPDQITVGANLLGWNLTEPIFRGLFSRVERLDPAAVAAEADRAVFRLAPATAPDDRGYPGPVRLRLTFPTAGMAGTSEPLVAAGRTGAADIVFVTYEAPGRLHFGLDHWGGPLLTSASLAVAPGSEHEVSIAIGTLWPPREGPPPGRVRVDLDGRTVLSGVRPPQEVRPEEITYGLNLAGGSTAGPTFSGRILEVRSWSGTGRQP